MSLGQKFQEALGVTERSSEAEHGLVDHRTPGSFPSDEPATASALDQDKTLRGDGHNKLHKKQDPRGRIAEINAPSQQQKGHGHTDSGVGLTQIDHDQANSGLGYDNSRAPGASSNDFSSNGNENNQPHSQNPDPSSVVGTGTVAAGAGGLSARAIGDDRSGQKASHAVNDEHLDRGVSNNPASSESRGHESHDNLKNERNNGGEKPTSQHGEPYWGDLPQGTGVYNSVVGHGSGEDTTAQHRHIPRAGDAQASPTSAGTGSLPFGAGVYNTVTGHGSDRKDDAHREPGTAATSTSFPQSETDSTLGSSKFPTSQDATHPEESKRGERLTETAAGIGAGAATYGVLHNRKDNEQNRHAGEAETASRRSKPDTKHEDKHDSKLAGIFHKSHDDKDVSSREHKHEKKHEPSSETKHHHEKPTGAAVITGTSSHDSTNDFSRSHGNQVTPNTTQSVNPLSSSSANSSQPPQEPHSHDSRNMAGLAGIGAGAAAGYGASRMAKHDNEPVSSQGPITTRDTAHDIINSPPTTGAVLSASTLHSTSATSAGVTANPSTTSATSSKMANPSTAGYTDSTRDFPSGSSGVDSRKTDSAESYQHLPSGTTSGIATQNVGGSLVTGSQDETPYNHLSTGTASGIQDADLPAPAPGGGDNYNHLPSGTPSGVVLSAEH